MELIKMGKFKYFCKNLCIRSKKKSAKKKAKKLERRMNKLANKADRICRNENDFNILANKIFNKRDYRIHMEKFKPHTYNLED